MTNRTDTPLSDAVALAKEHFERQIDQHLDHYAGKIAKRAFRNTLPDLVGALAAPPSHGWQPIDSAPKDKDVLLYQADEGVRAGYWEDDGFWRAVEDRLVTAGSIEPTHWLPMPAPPTAERER